PEGRDQGAEVPGRRGLLPAALVVASHLASVAPTPEGRGTMLASDIMTRTLVTVTAATSVPEAATLLASRGFTALPVVDDDRALIGLLTEIDILRDRFPHDPAS